MPASPSIVPQQIKIPIFQGFRLKGLYVDAVLQEHLGGGHAAFPAFLGIHRHDRIGEFQKMGLPRSVCPDDDIKTWGEGEICPFEDGEISDAERLKH